MCGVHATVLGEVPWAQRPGPGTFHNIMVFMICTRLGQVDISIVPSKVTEKRLKKLCEKHYIKLMCVHT
jgi:hypothetical protein